MVRLLAIGLVVMWAASAAAQNLYVDRDATASVHDGSSWCSAYLTVQDALVAAIPGTDILVADGRYTPDQGGGQTPGDRTATFQLKDEVKLRGGYSGCDAPDSNARDLAAYETILSGDLNGDDAPVPCTQNCNALGRLCIEGACIIAANNGENSYHVVTGSGTDATAVIDGFRITAGNPRGAYPDYARGGGMYNETGSPTVLNCTFTGNSAKFGGGMYNSGASPTVTNCTFSGNSADGGGISSLGGGGMYNVGSSPVLTYCTFRSNSAWLDAYSGVGGGGLANYGGRPTLTNCTFSMNSATSGAGMYNYSKLLTATNCTFVGNFALHRGGGIYSEGDWFSGPTLINCSFSGNIAGSSGGAMYSLQSQPTVTNCIVWDNGRDPIDSHDGGPTVHYSIVQGGWPGIGNSTSDPGFVSITDLRLMPGSPAIDAGNTTALPADVADLDGDADTAERIPRDLAGNPRVVDDGATVDTGVPGSSVVDMGAHEFQPPDCNGNSLPDECDLDCLGGQAACDVSGCGQSLDCNSNGVPDECEVPPICAGCADCNANFVPDGCEPDCNSNAIADECDITACADLPGCADRNRNSVPDGCEIGACCNNDPFGGCDDDLFQDECTCLGCEWTEFASCEDIECALGTIPTLGNWGLAILTLLTLIGAKILFGSAPSAGTLWRV